MVGCCEENQSYFDGVAGLEDNLDSVDFSKSLTSVIALEGSGEVKWSETNKQKQESLRQDHKI